MGCWFLLSDACYKRLSSFEIPEGLVYDVKSWQVLSFCIILEYAIFVSQTQASLSLSLSLSATKHEGMIREREGGS
jgi:hypothetical protein